MGARGGWIVGEGGRWRRKEGVEGGGGGRGKEEVGGWGREVVEVGGGGRGTAGEGGAGWEVERGVVRRLARGGASSRSQRAHGEA